MSNFLLVQTVKNYASRGLEPTDNNTATHMHPFVTFNYNFSNTNRQGHNSKMPSKLKSTIDLRAAIFWDRMPSGLV
jgi:hypothetical protein